MIQAPTPATVYDAPRQGAPLCDAVDPDLTTPAGLVQRCDLPAGHQATEHYDRVLGRVWVHTADLSRFQREERARAGFRRSRTLRSAAA